MANSTSWLPSRRKPSSKPRTAKKTHVWSANVVSWRSIAILLFMLGLAVQSDYPDQVYEIKHTSPIDLPDGYLAYHPGFKAAGSNIEGSFSYLQKTQTSSATTARVKFFDSSPRADFPHPGELSLTFAPPGSLLLRQTLSPQPGYMIFASIIKNQATANNDGGTALVLDTGSKPFGELATQNFLYQNPKRTLEWTFSDPNNNLRYVERVGPDSIVLGLSTAEQERFQAKITHPPQQAPVFLFDVFRMGKWVIYLDRSGTVYRDDDDQYTTGLAAVSTATMTFTTPIPNFYPSYAKLDLSAAYTTETCHILVSEFRESPEGHFIGMLQFQVQEQTHTKLKFPHLDVTSLGLLSAPIQPTGLKKFVVVGGNKFYAFTIFNDRFERDLNFAGPVIPGFVAGSLVVGQFESAESPSTMAPAMFFVQNEASYLVKMYIFDTTGCISRKANGECEQECTAETCPPISSSPTPTPEPNPVPTPNPAPTPEPIPTPAPTPNPSPSPAPASTVWPKEQVRRDLLRNQIDLLFADSKQTRPTYILFLIDLDTGKVYTCAQVGCSILWVQNTLRVGFASKIQVTRGVILFTKIPQSRILESPFFGMPRLLQDDQYDVIRVEDFQLIKEGWFFSWATVAQLIVFAFRTVGSLILFGKHPVVAMSMDLVVTHCVLLGLYLGPFLTSSELVLQIIGQVKIIWYWYPNPFFGWDRSALSCAPRPNHGAHGVACSFLDNYGQNVIGFAGFGLLLILLHYAAIWIQGRSATSGRVRAMCESFQRCYGMQYFIAKLDANQLEVMMYVLISYSLADSSSKSVVGLVLATALMVFYVVVAVGKTFLLHSNLKASPNQETTNLPQSGIILTQANETVAKHAEPRRESVGSTSRQATSKIAQYTIYLAFTMKGIRPISGLSQVFGPIVKLVRTFAICILLLNHTSSAVAQLIIGLLLESMYFGTLFFTRSEEKWFDFYSSVAVQLSVMLFLLLKAISTNSSIPSANNQGGMAVILSLTVLFMLATVCGCMICALVSLWFGSGDNEEKKQKIEQQTPREQKTMGASNKLQLVQEPEQVRSPDLAVRNPVSQQSVLFYELEIPEEFLDREVPEQVIQIQNRRVDTVTEQIQGSVAQPPRTGMPGISPALFDKESLLQKKTPRDGSKPSGV